MLLHFKLDKKKSGKGILSPTNWGVGPSVRMAKFFILK